MAARLEGSCEEIDSVEIGGDLEAGEGEGSSGNIQGGNEFGPHRSGRESLVRPQNDEGHVGSDLGAELLGAHGVIVAVVAEPEDNGVSEESVGLEVVHDRSCISIGLAHGVEVVGVPPAKEGVVGKVGGRGDPGGVDLVLPLAGVALAASELDLAEPRFVPGNLAPCREVALFAGDTVKLVAVVDEIVVVLPGVEGLVAVFPKDLREGGNPLGKMDRPGPGAGGAMIVKPRGGLVGSRDHGGTAGRAHRAGDVTPGEAHPLVREGIDAGRLALVHLVPVAVDPRRHVLDEDPEDVRPAFSRISMKPEEREEAEEQEREFHGE